MAKRRDRQIPEQGWRDFWSYTIKVMGEIARENTHASVRFLGGVINHAALSIQAPGSAPEAQEVISYMLVVQISQAAGPESRFYLYTREIEDHAGEYKEYKPHPAVHTRTS